MTLPGALLAFLIATACGLLFHLIRGGSLYRMAQFVFAAWVCFFAGHWLARLFGWQFGRLGSLNLLPALVATVLGLVALSFLARPETARHAPGKIKPPSHPGEPD
jgi:ABC-type amino acid transport system permease subunit